MHCCVMFSILVSGLKLLRMCLQKDRIHIEIEIHATAVWKLKIRNKRTTKRRYFI